MEKELSKEEILRKYCGVLPVSDMNGMRELQTDLSNVEDAMDFFADQQSKKEAIAFGIFLNENCEVISDKYWLMKAGVYSQKNTEQLYQLYSSQSKQ